MGIRYYAYPLAPEFVERAYEEPLAFLAADPLADAWFLSDDERPEMLYLDTCWHELQSLTWPDRTRRPRPAYRLFEGRVTHTPTGWIPWTRVLDPDEVDDIARDLVLIDEDDVDDAWDVIAGQPFSGDKAYVMHHLAAARAFLIRQQRAGWGLVYLIG
ncbi:hypothetical protein N8K70_07000 [Microbacterium betulae]|uniref:DUF1877 domain-containing protein n=1 Tax=Microbacterium betulae TaxID=2981139 RepID=A0AA97I884_9MICO|nr:hypothetical protein [Microbacterium sp. AB]WOF24407.1 hypothetical protein N8K70_07000 [Microbacterium sp. AB]